MILEELLVIGCLYMGFHTGSDWSDTWARKKAQLNRASPLTLRDNFRVLVRDQSTLALLLIDLEGVVL